jgi:hypothetical protein
MSQALRYERRSVMITSNLVFSKWDQIFKDPMTTMAAVDRLVHHAIILEFGGERGRGNWRRCCDVAPVSIATEDCQTALGEWRSTTTLL